MNHPSRSAGGTAGAARVELVPDRPVPLESLGGAWQVLEGFVDIFAVRRSADRLVGRREFLVRLAPGAGVAGASDPVAAPAVALLAIGSANAQLVRATDPILATEAWLLAVGDLLRDPDRGWTDRLASPGEISLPAGTSLGCLGQQVLWATVLAGDIAGVCGSAAVPVVAATPLLALAPSHLVLRPTGELSAPELDAGLAAHRALLLRHALSVLDQRAAERSGRIAHSAAASRAGMAAALSRLAGLATDAETRELEGDPVWLALAHSAVAMGQVARLNSPPAQAAPADRVQAHADALALRLRPVVLRGAWWRHDNGPLLALRTGSGDPVSLHPDRGGYRLFDPVAREERRLVGEEAATLNPEAWMIYRSFPAPAVRRRDLVRHVARGLRPECGGLLWLSVAAALLALAAPVAIALLAGSIIPKSDQVGLATMAAGLLAAALGAASVEVSRALLLQRMESRVTLDLQAALFDRLLRLPVDFFRRFGSGDLVDRVIVMEQVRRSLGGMRVGDMLAGVTALANVAVMLACNVKLGLLGLAIALLAAGVGLWLCGPQAKLERSLAERRGRAENLVLELISGIAKLKVAAATERAFGVWARLYGDQHRAFTGSRRVKHWQLVFGATVLPLASIALFVLAAAINEAMQAKAAAMPGWDAVMGGPPRPILTFGLAAWLAFSCAFGQLMQGIGRAVQSVSDALAALPLYARAQPILEAIPESGQGNPPPSALSGEIAFSRVSFGYASAATPVLQELSFAVRPGEFIAIVGPSGSGKSTILRLLLGFERPLSGAVLFDGLPLAALDAAAVRRQVGAVLQTARLQPGTILDAIGAGRPISLTEAWRAVELAGLGREIRALPMGMYTMLSEGGGTLSGGQRQRLLIARALARRPRLLLLDEATSALDNQTQSVVAAAVAGLGLTRVVVAHRLATIIAADRILVLDRGRLVQSGSYAELMAQPGLFRDLAQRQSP